MSYYLVEGRCGDVLHCSHAVIPRWITIGEERRAIHVNSVVKWWPEQGTRADLEAGDVVAVLDELHDATRVAVTACAVTA